MLDSIQLGELGQFAVMQGHYADAFNYFFSSALYRSNGIFEECQSLSALAMCFDVAGYKHLAQAYYDLCIPMLEQLDSGSVTAQRLMQSEIHGNYGIFLNNIGEYDEALKAFDQACVCAKQILNNSSLSRHYLGKGKSYLGLENFSVAMNYFHESFDICDSVLRTELSHLIWYCLVRSQGAALCKSPSDLLIRAFVRLFLQSNPRLREIHPLGDRLVSLYCLLKKYDLADENGPTR